MSVGRELPFATSKCATLRNARESAELTKGLKTPELPD
jgi:hypothetical protein